LDGMSWKILHLFPFQSLMISPVTRPHQLGWLSRSIEGRGTLLFLPPRLSVLMTSRRRAIFLLVTKMNHHQKGLSKNPRARPQNTMTLTTNGTALLRMNLV
jgi:hypothetical protein